MDLLTASPVEIDTALAEIYGRIAQADHAVDMAWSTVEYRAAEYMGRRGYRDPKYTKAEVMGAVDEVSAIDFDDEAPSWESAGNERLRWEKAKDLFAAVCAWEGALVAYRAVVAETAPYDAEFARRGGWTRAFLVNNSNGHVHSSMHCSTCFVTTSYCWLPEVSGHDEAEIVEKAGERACTVCYPSAPVAVLSRPTQFFTPDEVAKAAARVEKEAKRAEKKAAEIVVTGMMGWTNEGRGTHVYKTTRGATNAIAGWLGDIAHWGGDHPTVGEWENNVKVVREALAAKGIEYDFDKAQAAARKKAGK